MSPIISSSLPGLPTATASPTSVAPSEHKLLPPSTGDTVDLSSLGRALSALSQTRQTGSTASESSGYELPEEAQRLMELIQELQQQLQEKQQELIAIMADTHLSQEAKQLKLAELQASISALTNNLLGAMNQLLQMLEVTGEG